MSASTALGQASSVGRSTLASSRRPRSSGSAHERMTCEPPDERLHRQRVGERRALCEGLRRLDGGVRVVRLPARDRRRRRATARDRGGRLTQLSGRRLRARPRTPRTTPSPPTVSSSNGSEEAARLEAKRLESPRRDCLEQCPCPVGLARLEVRSRCGDQTDIAGILVGRRRETCRLLVECRARPTRAAPASGVGGALDLGRDCFVRTGSGEREMPGTLLCASRRARRAAGGHGSVGNSPASA